MVICFTFLPFEAQIRQVVSAPINIRGSLCAIGSLDFAVILKFTICSQKPQHVKGPENYLLNYSNTGNCAAFSGGRRPGGGGGWKYLLFCYFLDEDDGIMILASIESLE